MWLFLAALLNSCFTRVEQEQQQPAPLPRRPLRHGRLCVTSLWLLVPVTVLIRLCALPADVHGGKDEDSIAVFPIEKGVIKEYNALASVFRHAMVQLLPSFPLLHDRLLHISVCASANDRQSREDDEKRRRYLNSQDHSMLVVEPPQLDGIG